MPAPEPAERQMIARVAAHESWANTINRTARTAPARQAFLRKFEDLVDPARQLPAAERERRATNARKAHFSRLALRSAQARRSTARQRAALVELDEAMSLLAQAAESQAESGGDGWGPATHVLQLRDPSGTDIDDGGESE
ncbi:hypothetical protein [Flexivirga lutea]